MNLRKQRVSSGRASYVIKTISGTCEYKPMWMVKGN